MAVLEIPRGRHSDAMGAVELSVAGVSGLVQGAAASLGHRCDRFRTVDTRFGGNDIGRCQPRQFHMVAPPFDEIQEFERRIDRSVAFHIPICPNGIPGQNHSTEHHRLFHNWFVRILFVPRA